jgi:hypothetical protein
MDQVEWQGHNIPDQDRQYDFAGRKFRLTAARGEYDSPSEKA